MWLDDGDDAIFHDRMEAWRLKRMARARIRNNAVNNVISLPPPKKNEQYALFLTQNVLSLSLSLQKPQTLTHENSNATKQERSEVVETVEDPSEDILSSKKSDIIDVNGKNVDSAFEKQPEEHSTSSTSEWACSACTYLNAPRARSCAMCGSKKSRLSNARREKETKSSSDEEQRGQDDEWKDEGFDNGEDDKDENESIDDNDWDSDYDDEEVLFSGGLISHHYASFP